MSAGNGLPGNGRMCAPLESAGVNPHVGRRFHFLPKAERHALQRFAAQLIWIGYAIGRESDECLAKLDSQFLRLPIVRRNVRIERAPNGVERFLHGRALLAQPETGWW